MCAPARIDKEMITIIVDRFDSDVTDFRSSPSLLSIAQRSRATFISSFGDSLADHHSTNSREESSGILSSIVPLNGWTVPLSRPGGTNFPSNPHCSEQIDLGTHQCRHLPRISRRPSPLDVRPWCLQAKPDRCSRPDGPPCLDRVSDSEHCVLYCTGDLERKVCIGACN